LFVEIIQVLSQKLLGFIVLLNEFVF